jgi:hypothetical protein
MDYDVVSSIGIREMSSKFIQKMFPDGRLDGRGGMEVNGLAEGTVPQNVTIINQWQDHWDKKRREFFYVTDGEHVALLRVCASGDWVDYAEFAVIHNVAEVGTPEAEEAQRRAESWSEVL